MAEERGTTPPTIEEYRSLLADAREVVVALRVAVPPEATPESCVAWFDGWRNKTIGQWNHIRVLLDAPNPDGLASRLSEMTSVDRAISEQCDWSVIGPRAEAALSKFADHLFDIWRRLPDNGTPEAEQVSKFFPTLAAEFQPVAPPDTQARVP